MRHPIRLAAIAVAVLSVCAPITAQRKEATLEWQKRTLELGYGVVPVGKHSLDALKVGSTWRLGANDASTLRLAMPVLCGDTLLPPGHFRINLLREQEEKLSLALSEAGPALGEGGAEPRVAGVLSKLEKPVSKLAIDVAVAKKVKPVDGNQAAMMTVDFGEHRWTAEFTVLGGKASTKASGYTLVVFSVPDAVVSARGSHGIPVATLQKKNVGDGMPDGWNLVLAGETASLIPWMKAPTEQFGFGPVTPPDAAWLTSGTATARDSQAEDGPPVLTLVDLALQKGEFTVKLACGKQEFELVVPEPKAAKK